MQSLHLGLSFLPVGGVIKGVKLGTALVCLAPCVRGATEPQWGWEGCVTFRHPSAGKLVLLHYSWSPSCAVLWCGSIPLRHLWH